MKSAPKETRRAVFNKVSQTHQLGFCAVSLNYFFLQFVRQKARQEGTTFKTALENTIAPAGIKVGIDAPWVLTINI